ncbi:MAG: hypothetical protein WB985_07580 [Candidatus Acidiferrales bacterium]
MERTKDFPPTDFEDLSYEIWLGLGAMFYHAAYVKTYADARAMHLAGNNRLQSLLEAMTEAEREQLQEDLIIFRTHFAGLLWQLWHLCELVREGYRKSMRENIVTKERHDILLNAIDIDPIVDEIRLYRHMSHQRAGVIVTLHATGTDAFCGHVFPPLHATAPVQKEEVSIEDELRERELGMKLRLYCQRIVRYSEEVFKIMEANKGESVLPRTRGFSVTIPYFYEGELPEGAKDVVYVRAECAPSAEKDGSV